MIGLFVSLLIQIVVIAVEVTIALVRLLILVAIAIARAIGRAMEQASRQRRSTAGLPRRRIPLPQDLRWAVFARDRYACTACGDRIDLTVDHIHPVSLGGTNAPENLQTLCRRCNCAKGARIAA